MTAPRDDGAALPDASIVIEQLERAASLGERARILLRLPDAMLLADGEAVARACVAAGFDLGMRYVSFRRGGLFTVRTPFGSLPFVLAKEAERARQALCALVAEEDRERSAL